MIYKEMGGFYCLQCDVCGEEAPQLFDDFDKAVEWKKDKAHGWRSVNVDGEWQEQCPECAGDDQRSY